MPPRRKTSGPRPYGRQHVTKTIKSLSLSAEVAEWAEKQADTHTEGNFSDFVQGVLARERSRQAKRQK